MLSQSNQYCGYLVWLDFTRVESNPDFDILARPQILPYIPTELLKADDSQCKKLIEAAKTIASVAHKTVYEYEHNLINKDTNPYRSIAEATSDFQQKTLHISEYNWYKERTTWEEVIQIGIQSIFYLFIFTTKFNNYLIMYNVSATCTGKSASY
jgi:hypothetical protein